MIGTSARRAQLGHSGDLAIFARQVGYEQKLFWRNRQAVIFNFAFPILFLVIFTSINGSAHLKQLGGVSYATFFVPGILTFGIISSTFTNLAISLVNLRDQGILKRVRGTPMPPWLYLAARIGNSVVISAVMVVIMLALGVGAFGVHLRLSTLPGLVVGLVVGAASFCALGLAMTGVIRNAESAPAVVNIVVLPFLFLSGIFFPLQGEPSWLASIVKVFPVAHFANSLEAPFNPHTAAPGIQGSDVAVLVVWAVIGLVVALRLFRWESDKA